MDPLNQIVFNWALTIAGLCGGWVLKILYDKLHDLQIADLALADKVQSIEVLVAGQYIKRTEMEKMYEAMFAKLDRIESKIDKKVDKP